MELLFYVTIFTYVIYVIFGDSLVDYFILNKEATFPPKLSLILKRFFYISYISLLLTSIFMLNKTKALWNLAFSFSLFSLVGFIIKQLHEKSLTHVDYLIRGIILHIVFILPLLYYPEYYDFNINPKIITIIVWYIILAGYFNIYR